MGRKRRHDPGQPDLFEERPYYPVRAPRPDVEPFDFASKVARTMSEALRRCSWPRDEVALRMSRFLGGEVSKAMLDAYTAESKTTHQISLVRMRAFVRATEQWWVWDELLKDDGLTVLQGDEAVHAEIGRIEQEMEEAKARLKELRGHPVKVRRRR